MQSYLCQMLFLCTIIVIQNIFEKTRESALSAHLGVLLYSVFNKLFGLYI